MTETTHPLPGAAGVRWIVTTEDAPWVEQAPAALSTPTAMPSTLVDLEHPQQVMEGFGASFNEFGWDALALLSEADRDAVMRALFEPGTGLDLALCRMPLGANDFSRDWYSYDELEGDFELSGFSIAHDEETLIPFIRAAKRHQPALRLWASPWSPPTWMKDNGHYACSAPMALWQRAENGLQPHQVRAEDTDTFIQEDRYLDAYARYFGRFIDAYAERDIAIGMVMPQNEFNSAQVFPSCTWTPQGLARFIRHLGPEMARRGVEIFLGTLERPKEWQAEAVLDDPGAGPFVSGVGVQWAGKGAVPYLHRKRPELRIYQSEQECGDGLNDWRFARYTWSLIRHYMTHGASAYMYWNMALVEGGISRWGWAQNSLVVVDPVTRSYRFSHEYQLLKHMTHFVRPGARVLPTSSYAGFEQQLAWRNPDGGVVLVVHNDTCAAQEWSALLGGLVLTATLPADSFSTFVIPATS